MSRRLWVWDDIKTLSCRWPCDLQTGMISKQINRILENKAMGKWRNMLITKNSQRELCGLRHPLLEGHKQQRGLEHWRIKNSKTRVHKNMFSWLQNHQNQIKGCQCEHWLIGYMFLYLETSFNTSFLTLSARKYSLLEHVVLWHRYGKKIKNVLPFQICGLLPYTMW